MQSYLPFAMLDAVTNYDVYGDLGTTGYAGQDAIDKYFEQQRAWRDQAWSSNCGFIPSAVPGFNNRALGSQLGALSRSLQKD